jgi:5-methylcytosine-specific restriction endonuclease McrA
MRPRCDSFYMSKHWISLRDRWRRSHPCCARCGAKAQHVDHIIDIRTAPERRLDWFNLQSLCQPCHNAKTAADRAGKPIGPHGGCDADGNPTDPQHPWAADHRMKSGRR